MRTLFQTLLSLGRGGPRLLPVFAALLVGGCNMSRMGVNMTAPALKLASGALDTESDVIFAREAAPGGLKTVEGFLLTSPENPDLLETAANGYAQYTFGFLEDDLDALPENVESDHRQILIDRCTTLYDRSLAFSLRLAALRDPQIIAAVKGDTQALTNLLKARFTHAEDGRGLYWAGLAMGSGINLHKDDVDRIADLPKAVALLERSHEIAPEYFNHGPAMALGVVYSAQGKAMGGNPERSKQLFDEVIQATGGKYLMARVLYARYYATVTQDRALFEKTLKDVLGTPSNIWPEQRLANELAKRRAVRYLSRVEDYF